MRCLNYLIAKLYLVLFLFVLPQQWPLGWHILLQFFNHLLLWTLPREIDGFQEPNTWKTTIIRYRSLLTCRPCSDLWRMKSCKRVPNSLLNRSKGPAYTSLHPAMALSGVEDPGAVSTKTQDWSSRTKCWNWTHFFSFINENRIHTWSSIKISFLSYLA